MSQQNLTLEEIGAIKLRLHGMSEDKMNAIISKLEILINQGFNPHDIFPLGIPGDPDDIDKAVVKFITKPGDEHHELIDFINNEHALTDLDRRIFTLGIIRNDLMETQLTLGSD